MSLTCLGEQFQGLLRNTQLFGQWWQHRCLALPATINALALFKVESAWSWLKLSSSPLRADLDSSQTSGTITLLLKRASYLTFIF